MAGPTTAERDAGLRAKSGRAEGPSARRFRLPGGRLLIVLIIVVMFVGSGMWVLYGSNWLRVKRVSTSGTDVLTRDQVEAAAAVPVGSPLISVDTRAIEARVLRKLPRIDSIDVVRSWPHGIGLKVAERKPVLLIEKGTDFIEVDSKGVRFATVGDAPRGVPLLKLTADHSPSLRRFGNDRLALEAVRVRRELPGGIAKDTKAVRVRSYDSITLELRGGRTVMWGSAEDGPAKARALTALMKAVPDANQFDVSAPTAPAASGS
ncbi:cell division protein FtsQ/DivIB [Streptomyces sp. NPDC088725]|uniref:cell division protein FtsQ/DivIB n=1 Tax=Streptomyces sp. NPDC088725 TaxID=3365873 RepID=UPI003803894E